MFTLVETVPQKHELKYVSKLQGHFVRFLDNFRNFRPIEVFSSAMSSQTYEDNFQMNVTWIMEIYAGEK